MNNNENNYFIFCIGTAMATGIVLLGIILFVSERNAPSINKRWEQEAIKRGYGEYVVNVEKKEVSFKWKE